MADQDRARWTRLVADFEVSDLSQREFASERGISLSNLRYWIYRLRKESRPLVTEASERSGQAPERAKAKAGSRLLPVRVVASAAPKARQPGGFATPVSTWPAMHSGSSPTLRAATSKRCSAS